MSKWTCEVVKDFNGLYYCNMCIDGKMVEGLPEYVDYNTLKAAIRRMTGIEILKHKNMIFEGSGRKRYALIDNTQTRNDCRVTLQERINGWKPCFDKYYKIRFSAEEVDYATIKMTEYEAEIVKRILEEANNQVEGYCGSVEFLGEVDDL